MATLTIINGNNNDKDNTRAYMVKGQDGISPVVNVSKTDGVATITITDREGTHTTTISDGADLTDGAVPQGAVIGFDGQTVPAGYEEVASSEDDVEVGTILQFSGSTWQVPNNYLLCNGQEISRTDYSDLFNIIGTSFGAGDGSTTFNLPDFRGRTGVGLDSEQTEFDTLGEKGGEKTHTLDISEMPSHNHDSGVSAGGTSTGYGLNYEYSTEYRYYDGNDIIADAGGSQPHNNLQPYIIVNYIIKASKGTITKKIKKVSVSPLPRNQATVIDSLNTSDSQTTNAPSIRAVKQAFIDAEEVEIAEVNGLSSDDNLSVNLKFKKVGKVVHVTARLTMDTTVDQTGNIYKSFTMPEIARTKAINSIAQLNGFSNASVSSNKINLTDVESLSIIHASENTNTYTLAGIMADVNVSGVTTKIISTSYIIED